MWIKRGFQLGQNWIKNRNIKKGGWYKWPEESTKVKGNMYLVSTVKKKKHAPDDMKHKVSKSYIYFYNGISLYPLEDDRNQLTYITGLILRKTNKLFFWSGGEAVLQSVWPGFPGLESREWGQGKVPEFSFLITWWTKQFFSRVDLDLHFLKATPSACGTGECINCDF